MISVERLIREFAKMRAAAPYLKWERKNNSLANFL